MYPHRYDYPMVIKSMSAYCGSTMYTDIENICLHCHSYVCIYIYMLYPVWYDIIKFHFYIYCGKNILNSDALLI